MAQVVQEVHGTSESSGSTNTTSGESSNNNNNTSSNAVKSSNSNSTTLETNSAQNDFKGFNNNTSTYNVTREEETEGQLNDSNEGLKELTIEGIKLSPEFQTNVYEYTAKYIGEGTQLNLTAKATNDDYIVEITGNENLQEGENTITILVSKSNGTNVATYQVIVNKSLIDEEAIARQKQEETERRNTIILICAIIGVILIIGIIVFMKIRRKKNKTFLNDNEVDSLHHDDEDNNANNENNEEDNEYEELPKALIGQEKSDIKKPIKGKRFKDE